MAKKTKTQITEQMTTIIVAPVITEKATLAGENNAVVFKVAPTATKPQIKAAVEALYGVEVEKVNTVNIQGKTKRFRGFKGKRSDVRKAYVCLKSGHSIDLSTGI